MRSALALLGQQTGLTIFIESQYAIVVEAVSIRLLVICRAQASNCASHSLAWRGFGTRLRKARTGT